MHCENTKRWPEYYFWTKKYVTFQTMLGFCCFIISVYVCVDFTSYYDLYVGCWNCSDSLVNFVLFIYKLYFRMFLGDSCFLCLFFYGDFAFHMHFFIYSGCNLYWQFDNPGQLPLLWIPVVQRHLCLQTNYWTQWIYCRYMYIEHILFACCN